MEISYQISWSRSSDGNMCNSSTVTNKYLFPGLSSRGGSSLNCQYGCSDAILPHMPYVCTYFNISDDWSFGEHHMTHVFRNISDINIITIGTVGVAWISEAGGSDFNVSTTFSLVARSDTKKINSSPRVLPTPPLRLQSGCTYTIPLPVSDPDNDTIKCRWAVGSECGSICNDFIGAILDSNTCTITYTANYGTGIKAVAIMIEDYAPRSPYRPLSSVALQFLILVHYSSQSCSSHIEWFRCLSITLHPSNKTVFSNQSLTLTCMANETSSYYWERQNGNISFTSVGVLTNTLTLINIQPEDTGSYRCVTYVCSSCCRSFSNYAVITVGKLILLSWYYLIVCFLLLAVPSRPTIFLHPSSQYINLTETATFTCNATGYNVNYHWTIQSGSFPNKVTSVNSNTLIISDVRSSDVNTYVCVASNQGGSVSSHAAKLMAVGM